jgi:ABC-type taurine transport system ATPase subunit
MSYLELTNIHKAFGTSVAVENFNLSVEQGEFISFLGPSGCGKTTTLRMIAGFEVPTSGYITINSNDLTYLPPNKRNVGMVFQSYALFPNMTVAQNVGYGLKIAGKNKSEIAGRVEEMLALIHLEDFGNPLPVSVIWRTAAARRTRPGFGDSNPRFCFSMSRFPRSMRRSAWNLRTGDSPPFNKRLVSPPFTSRTIRKKRFRSLTVSW